MFYVYLIFTWKCDFGITTLLQQKLIFFVENKQGKCTVQRRLMRKRIFQVARPF